MPIPKAMRCLALMAVFCLFASTALVFAAPDTNGAENTHRGYYRDPAVHGDTGVFTSEGDL